MTEETEIRLQKSIARLNEHKSYIATLPDYGKKYDFKILKDGYVNASYDDYRGFAYFRLSSGAVLKLSFEDCLEIAHTVAEAVLPVEETNQFEEIYFRMEDIINGEERW